MKDLSFKAADGMWRVTYAKGVLGFHRTAAGAVIANVSERLRYALFSRQQVGEGSNPGALPPPVLPRKSLIFLRKIVP